MLPTPASTPWLQFTPLSLVNGKQGSLWRQPGAYVGRYRTHDRWFNQLVNLWEQSVIEPRIARTFPFDGAAGTNHFVQDGRTQGNCWSPLGLRRRGNRADGKQKGVETHGEATRARHRARTSAIVNDISRHGAAAKKIRQPNSSGTTQWTTPGANSGRSPTTWRTGYLDPKATFRFDAMNGRKTRRSGRCVAQKCRRD
jgi:hypothetical protein